MTSKELHQRSRELQKLGKEAATNLANLVNPFDSRPARDAFIAQLTEREHRTLQQQVASLMLDTFRAWAAMEEWQYDGRNEATVKLAREIVKVADNHHLPMV